MFKFITAFSSVILIIVANMVPVVGAVFFNWDTRAILPVYWAENVIIGVFTVLKMLKAQGAGKPIKAIVMGKSQMLSNNSLKNFMAVFFSLHYGIFSLVHGIFIVVITAMSIGFEKDLSSSVIIGFFLNFFISVIFIFISHTFSYFSNYIGKKEYLQTNQYSLMFRPYPRIFITQFTIIIGMNIMLQMNNAQWIFYLLVAFKTLVDIIQHVWVHRLYMPYSKVTVIN